MDLNFDASQVKPRDDFEALPAGKYKAHIIASEGKPTRAGTGAYLKLTIEILDGTHAGRKLWENLNLENPNHQAVQIARATLAQICGAVGLVRIASSEELHNRPMTIVVVCERDKRDGEIRNRIRKYQALDAVGGAATPAGGQVAGSTPPWRRQA